MQNVKIIRRREAAPNDLQTANVQTAESVSEDQLRQTWVNEHKLNSEARRMRDLKAFFGNGGKL
jgi:hypothetical protein